jgi:hypothetical protein
MMLQRFDDNRKSTPFNKLKSIAAVFALATAFFIVGAAHVAETKPNSTPSKISFREKVEQYKKFKEKYEDKDFQLTSYPVHRVEHGNGKSSTYAFNVYHITYGVIADNIKEFGKSRKQIVRNPTNSQRRETPVCQSRLFVEDYNESGIYPEVTCLEEAEHSNPISLIVNTLSKEELKDVAIIYEFTDGDLDIQFSLDKGRDKKLVERLYAKLKRADEKMDENRQAVKMEPIIPTKNQRITAAYMDEDKDGEPDFVLIPYCINGSFFNEDPGNNTIQVALKYKLVTGKDLAGKTRKERKVLENRIGLWMWDKPCEILTSFSENPGPDIVFYDFGKMVYSKIIDPKPDGKFDKYEFLY